MERDDRMAGGRGRAAAKPRSYLFTVRLWKQDGTGGPAYRGSVREVVSGANRHFQDWSELAAFMMAQLEEAEADRAEWTEGGT